MAKLKDRIGEKRKKDLHQPEKRLYIPPKLNEYGSLEKLTQSGGSVGTDGSGTKRGKLT
jgi:hypothetical protein